MPSVPRPTWSPARQRRRSRSPALGRTQIAPRREQPAPVHCLPQLPSGSRSVARPIQLSVAAPITSAPRNGALRADSLEIVEEILLTCIVTSFAASFATAGGVAGTAMERLPFPFSLPGMCSSITTWKLVPPKPNALTPARRTPPAGIVPGLQFGVDVQRRVSEVDLRTGMLAMQAGWQHLVAQRQGSLQTFLRLRQPL